jgi:hypothetical protein
MPVSSSTPRPAADFRQDAINSDSHRDVGQQGAACASTQSWSARLWLMNGVIAYESTVNRE